MNIIEQIYDNYSNKINFLERKISIQSRKTIIKGPPKSGKSYLIYDYLSKFDKDKFLYIDFDDYRNSIDEIEKYLLSFIDENSIDIVVFENFNFDIDLPNIEDIIITTKKDIVLDDFKTIYLEPLDFEEFLLFDIKHQNISNSFNSFLKFGNFPEIIEYSEYKKPKRNYEICKLYCEDKTELNILLLLIKSAGEKKSLLQLYNFMKKKQKISKDKFYRVCENYKNNRIIYFCEKYKQPKAVKKIFIFNYALLDIISYNKNFNNLFKNMVYLELYNEDDKNNIFYLDNIDFYISNKKTIILTIPFFNNLLIGSVSKKILSVIEKVYIEKIIIITVSNDETTFYIDDIVVDVVKFYDWVLGDEDE